MRIAVVVAVLALGACQSPDVSRSLGARCALTSDCNGLCLGPSGEWPGGFCTTACDSDASCGDGASCVDQQGLGVCAFTCTGDADCVFLGQYACTAIDRHNAGNKAMVCRGG